MRGKIKTLALVLAAVLLTAAVSVYATVVFYDKDGSLTVNERRELEDYRDKQKNGLVLQKEEAEYLQALTAIFAPSFDVLQMVDANFYKDTSGFDFALGAAKGIVEILDDPYSYYLNAEEFDRLRESMNNEYVGIGVVVTPAEDGYITVVSPFRDSPAQRAGIQPLDKVVAVNGERVKGDQLNRAVELIRGEPGTKVNVTFMREDEEFEVEFIRETIKVETVASEILEEGIGYIAISQFGSNTAEEFEQHYKEITANTSIKGIIIDLRYNPGGELGTLLYIADLLLDKQVIITLKNKQGEIERYESDARNKYDGEMVVLVNNGSASASEALTGAIKDSGSGIVVGTRTYGKGVAQTLYPLGGGNALNITTAEYFTPNGTNVNEKGIEPDHVIENDPDLPGDEQLEKAKEVIRSLFE